MSINPNIFTYDYQKMREHTMKPGGLAEQLAAAVFHPERLNRLCEQYNIEFDELMEIYWKTIVWYLL